MIVKTLKTILFKEKEKMKVYFGIKAHLDYCNERLREAAKKSSSLNGRGGGLRAGSLRKKDLFLEPFFPTAIKLEGGGVRP